jgi:hypothetical protein
MSGKSGELSPINAYNERDRVAIVTPGRKGIGLAVTTLIFGSGGKVSIWDSDKALPAEGRRQGSNPFGRAT